ncbi:universal stress protein [Arthrobacter sp. PAMC25564]|uniref:universal stress protein n=1 Tax=Arthrobacter sp. PAMC25564 TaxID=2565366 RepID=UPI0010A23D1D|nr:universal stress protein [Arthrobacter sp. PAMC25564]QCB95773.1 universal stress protein [Arthrobacter sp. PAMC25564]
MAPAAGHERTAVAVGYDGSEAAQLAVRWAAGYAAAGKSRLRVIHAWVWPLFTRNLGPVKGIAGSGLRHSAEAILAEGVELARSIADASADVEGVMEAGLPAPVLRAAAADARVLVVGSRGIGGVLGQLAGSVCLELAGSSPCPLMVIWRPRTPGRPVVAGVDASARGPATLAGAVRLAEALGTSLQLVHVGQADAGNREEHGRHSPLHGQELLDHALEAARKLAPGLTVSGSLKDSHSVARELLAAASGADALVLGTHNREGGPGNTVSAVLHKARCNVLITR